MDLVYIHYNRDGKNSYFYFIPFFTTPSGDICGLRTLDSKGFPLIKDGEISLLKQRCNEIDAMKSEEKYKWLVEHIVNFKAAYRTLVSKYIVEAFPYRINRG